MRDRLLLQELTGVRRDRAGILSGHLERCRIPFEWISAGGGRHLAVHAPDGAWNQASRLVLTAHYDRHPRSPGANDNGAAVATLLAWLENAWEHLPAHVSVLFTDREEIFRGESLEEQGAFALAGRFRRKKHDGLLFLHIDAFGRGEVPVLSNTAGLWMRRHNAGRAGREGSLRHRALVASLKAKLAAFGAMELTTPLSDEVGMMLQGYGAALLTCLPRAEAENWRDRKEWPETWSLLNGPGDQLRTLDPKSPALLRRILDRLTGWRAAAESAA